MVEAEKIMEQLNDEISREIDKLEDFEPGTEKHAAAVDSVCKLHKLRIEEMRIGMEWEEKEARRQMDERQQEREESIKREQMEAEKEYRMLDLNIKQQQLTAEVNQFETEMEFKKEELTHRKETDIIGFALDIATALTKLAFFGKWMKRGFQFEKDGTFTSSTFKSLTNKFKPD